MEGVKTIASGAAKRWQEVRALSDLTASWANSDTIDMKAVRTIAALIVYTMGDAETSNAIEVRLAVSDDGTNWYYDTEGQSPLSPAVHSYQSLTSPGVNNMFRKIFEVPAAAYARIQVRETGVQSNYGQARLRVALAPW